MKNLSFKGPGRSVLALMLLLAAPGVQQALAQGSEQAAPVQVIPQPKKVELIGHSFRFRADTKLVLADARSEQDRFAADEFISDVRETAGLTLSVGKRRGSGAILIGGLDQRAISEALQRAGVSVPASLNEEGYVLSAGPGGVVVGGASPAGVFYGMQTLKQLVRGEGREAYIPGVKITDWPSMRWRGVSDDISRGPVPTVDYIKKQLRTFAAFKLNMHSFYMEHVFKSSAHPLIGPEGGSLTPDEIRDLVSYARRYHIELVPEQQTFGHLHKALRIEKYSQLAEMPNGDVLSPQQEGSYKLVADWYRELNDLFPGKFFHIGEDETFELGEGQSRDAVKAKGVGVVYFDHLQKVRELLKPYDRKLMFWGDIALNHPDLLDSIPKDLIVMNWAYGPRDSYMSRIEPFRKAGLQQFVCPGVQNWNQIFPNTDAAAINISNFVRDGKASNALGMMNTSWDDDGEALFETSWYGIMLGAAASWQEGTLDVEAFDRNFDWALFRNPGDQFVNAVHALGGVNKQLGISSSDSLFWQDPFTTAFQLRTRELSPKVRQMRLSVENAEESLLRDGARARRNRELISTFKFAAQRFDHLGRRMQVTEQFSRTYWDAYLNLGDRRKMQPLRRYAGTVYNSLREMSEELTLLRSGYREQWLRENRPYWLDSVLARYDLAINNWLAKSQQLAETLREYDRTSTLPNPEEFGLGPRPQELPGGSQR
jgi:hexosaminidase